MHNNSNVIRPYRVAYCLTLILRALQMIIVTHVSKSNALGTV